MTQHLLAHLRFLDDHTGEPEWITVNTGMFGSNESFVPLAQAQANGSDVRVPYTKDQVTGAPNVAAETGHLSQDEEAELYKHYGLPYDESYSESGLPTGEREETTAPAQGQTPPRAAGEQAMTRSEERLRVGTQKRQRGKARLRKWVETEHVQQTVPVRRQKARLETTPITDENVDEATSGPAFTEDEHEVTLQEEVPVVEKEVRPVEQVRMTTEEETGEETVTDEVRKEQIEAEGDTQR